jgi:isopenicillin N synthase-like dioxygenase
MRSVFHAPQDLVPGYRAANEAYFAAMAQVAFRVLRLLGLALGLGGDYFLPYFTRPMMFHRPLHYSAQRSDEAAGIFAAGAHCDYGMLTFLCTDDVPGLQASHGRAGASSTACVV